MPSSFPLSSPVSTTRIRSSACSAVRRSPAPLGKATGIVSRDTKTVAFRNPRVQKQTVLHVRFDGAGNVLGVDQTGKELVANINPNDDKTPTLGRKRSLFDDLFGNIGTVNSPAVPSGGGY